MSNPLISIIIPAYNCENYIAHCLDSILEQTYDNYEIIIVNDGSKDNTVAIVDEYEKNHKRIKVIHQPNGGVTRARLNGVANATGEYIGFVDSDDEIESDMYEILVRNAVKFQADISHCGYQMVFPSRIDKYYGTGEIIEQDNKTGIKDLIAGTRIEPGLCNKLFSRKLFEPLIQNGLMDLTVKNNEDLLMNYYLFRESSKSIFEDVCKYHYMVHANSATSKSLNINQLLDPLKVKKILLSETADDTECQYILTSHIASHLAVLATRSLRENPGLIKPVRKDARKELRALVPEILKKYNTSLKIKTVWAAYLPTSYRWVHNIYLKLTGLDKIYEIS